MKTINTPLTEKFNILSYLQQEVKIAGNFSISYLKTKKMFQISFVNGLGYKGLSPKIDGCIDAGINQLEIAYEEEHGKSYQEAYDLIQSNLFLKDKVSELEANIRLLEEKYELKKVQLNREYENRTRGMGYKQKMEEQSNENFTGFVNYAEEPAQIIPDKPKRKRGRPSKMKTEELVNTILSPINEICEDYKEKQKEKKVKKRRTRKSKLYTDEKLEKEIKRLNPNFDLNFTKNGNSKRYKEERLKAYKRLTAKKYTKLSLKRENLAISKNKYNITKDDIISDMKRVLKSELDGLSNIQYIREWTKAKSRVWNREYNHAKKDFGSSW